MCLACCSRDDTFQILKMIIRGHVVLVSAHFVGKAVIGDIYHNKKVGTTNRFFDVTLALTGTKTDDLGINQKRWKAVTLWNLAWFLFGNKFFTEFYKFLVNLIGEILTSCKCCNANRRNRS